MIEAVAVTILPLGFLVILFGGGALFLRDNIEQDGKAPINRTLFYTSKYSVVIVWGAMVVQAWGINISSTEVPPSLSMVALFSWFFGFLFLYLGRFAMGNSFRLGTAREETSLKDDGLFGLNRNPMYMGMYATIAGSSLYTLNLIVILLGAFIIAIHHTIVLAEEKHMQNVFGQKYVEYSSRVRRYI